MNVAVVGLGFGAAFVPIYKRHPFVGRVAVSDQNPKLLAEVADRHGIEDRFESLEAVLADDRYDAVHLLTPIPAHADQTVAVLESGRHCACAVPTATSLADLRRIVSVQAATGKNYMLMETAIYDRAFLYVREMLDRGEFGRLTFMAGQYFQDIEGDYPAYWRALPPMHYATHSLSPLLALAGRRATHVACLGSGRLRADIQEPDGTRFPLQSALFRLEESDVIIQLTRSWFQVARQYTEAWSLYGEDRSFEWQQLDHEDPVLCTLEPLQPGQRGRDTSAIRVDVPYRSDLYPPELAEFARGWHGGSHPHLVHEFVLSCIESRPSAINAVTAANWTAAGICANDSSLRDGAVVEIPGF
ncbi:MAG TPA: Gfo/Idh/MocA family oxidoreductase [Fimbriimonadaceae bacterium]|nr:Gfo/Idh/MocA family oxidoreductase [Fimbriimonadaceae bacterium]